MAEHPLNLAPTIYLGVFSRAEQRVLQAIFKAIAKGGGKCVATLAMLARDSNTSRSTTRNAIAQAVAIGLLKKTERRSYCAVSLPNILTYGEQCCWSVLRGSIVRFSGLARYRATASRESSTVCLSRPQTSSVTGSPP
jgi:hypothetical protein